MGAVIVVNDTTRRILDSTWPSVDLALKKRIEELKQDPDKLAELNMAMKRYPGLGFQDVSIEPVRVFEDGKRLVCMISRKAGFARVDIEVEPLPAGFICGYGKKTTVFKTVALFEKYLSHDPDVDGYIQVEENGRWYVVLETDKSNDGKIPLVPYFFDTTSTVKNEPYTNVDGKYTVTFTDPSVMPTDNKLHFIFKDELTLVPEPT